MKKRSWIRLIVLQGLFLNTSFGQEIDSIQEVIRQAKHDTVKINAYKSWDDLIYYKDPKKDEEILFIILSICRNDLKSGRDLSKKEIYFYRKNSAWALSNIGIIYASRNEYTDALRCFFRSVKIRERLKEYTEAAGAYNNIGNVYMFLGNYPLSLHYYLKGLKYNEQSGIKKNMANSYNNLGIIYTKLEQNEKAVDYFLKAQKIDIELKDERGIGISKINLGQISAKTGDPDQAINHYIEAKESLIRAGDPFQLSIVYNSLGNVYYYKNEFLKARICFYRSDSLASLTTDKRTHTNIQINIAKTYLATGDVQKAKELIKNGLQLSKELGMKEFIRNAYLYTSKVDSAAGDYRSAFINYKQYVIYADSLSNEENTKKTTQTQMQYEFDKKEAKSKSEQDKKDAIANAEKKRQQMILWLVSGVLILVGIFSLIIFRNLRITKRQKLLIEEQKKLVEEQKDIVEEKQKEILDSIRYAKRIQMALLPGEKFMAGKLKPKH